MHCHMMCEEDWTSVLRMSRAKPNQLFLSSMSAYALSLPLHRAFKGTARVGTTDPRREAQLLDSIDEGQHRKSDLPMMDR